MIMTRNYVHLLTNIKLLTKRNKNNYQVEKYIIIILSSLFWFYQ